MAKITVLNQEGKNVSELELNDSVFGIEPHKQAMFDMVIMQRASRRQGTHKVKGRSEVRGGGRKPWRQKGTGRARQGSIRAPQWRGGGIVFGPTPRKYGYKINRKIARLALRSALSSKVIDNEMIVLDDIKFDAPKTKDMIKVLENLNTGKKSLLVMDEVNDNVMLSARNIPGLMVMDSTGINVYDVLNSNHLIVTEAAVKAIEEVLG